MNEKFLPGKSWYYRAVITASSDGNLIADFLVEDGEMMIEHLRLSHNVNRAIRIQILNPDDNQSAQWSKLGSNNQEVEIPAAQAAGADESQDTTDPFCRIVSKDETIRLAAINMLDTEITTIAIKARVTGAKPTIDTSASSGVPTSVTVSEDSIRP